MEAKKISMGKVAVEGAFVGIWIIATELLVKVFGLGAGWPAIMALLLYFISGRKTKNLAKVFGGGTAGILMALLLVFGTTIMGPYLGTEVAKFLSLFIIVFLNIILGKFVPVLFNDFAVTYLCIALIYSQQQTINWIITLFIGGGFFIGGLELFLKYFYGNKDKKTQESVSEIA